MEETLKGEISFILDCNLRDVLIQLGSWWTRSHIEIGGSDSITKTIVEKLFFLLWELQVRYIGYSCSNTPDFRGVKHGAKDSELPSDI